MKKRRIAARDQRSSALVITLLGLVLLTIIVVAFMQTMSLSLTASKSYTDIQRATLAAQAGLDTAIAQIAVATGTNLAFVTGVTNFPTSGLPTGAGATNFPLTVIGKGNLTNLDQMMPLSSGPIAYLTNFGAVGFAANFSTYASARANGSVTQTIDVNAQPYQFIRVTGDTNEYRASWVTMTNIAGTKTSFTRFAYVVLDDSARVNPSLFTGGGTGNSDPTNWYTGPQDYDSTYLTNNAGVQIVSAFQMTNGGPASAYSNSFAYSDATMGITFPSRAAYETNKYLLTSLMNPSFDVIPAWMSDGGMPKYNINDLATNSVYGTTPAARATNIAKIITRNLPSFYLRDAALRATNSTLYVQRVANCIVDYVNTNAFNAVGYTQDPTGVASGQELSVFPILIAEHLWSTNSFATPLKTAALSSQFWVSAWNPYSTPVTIKSAVLHVSNRPAFTFGTATNYPGDYSNSMVYPSGTPVVPANGFISLAFATNTFSMTSTTSVSSFTGVVLGSGQYKQYQLSVNGQVVAQSQQGSLNGGTIGAGNAPVATPGGGLEGPAIGAFSTYGSSAWNVDYIDTYGTEVADPRFSSFCYTVWPGRSDLAGWTSTAWNGRSGAGGAPPGASARIWNPLQQWVSRDSMMGNPTPGSSPNLVTQTPDTLTPFPVATTNAAPEYTRNGPMVSIGELCHIYDPAHAGDDLTTNTPFYGGSATAQNYFSPFQAGGARSLRIGRPEFTGATNTTGATTADSWDVSGERAISLLDLFTVNNPNTTVASTNTVAQSLISGGALGRINPNTASSNVLAMAFSGIKITSNPGMTNASGTVISPAALANVSMMASNVIANRPYSSLSDLYAVVPSFDVNTNYTPNFSTNAAGYFSVANRVHQEAFGKWVQHLTVQSRSYRIYVIGQVLDNAQNPRGSVAMEAGIYLQYSPTEGMYTPVIQYLHLLK